MDFSATNPGVYNCYQSVYSWFLRENGYDYYSVAIRFLTFKYNADEKLKIGERIDPLYMRDSKLMRDDRLGVYFSAFDIADKAEMNRRFNRGEGLFIWGDLYNCFWNSAYGKYHFSHCFVVYAQHGDLYIYDPFFNKVGVKIDYEGIKRITNSFFVFQKYSVPKDSLERILHDVQMDAMDYKKQKMAEGVDNFAKDLSTVDLFEEIGMENKDFFAIPLLDNVRAIGLQRGAYALLIDFLSLRMNLDCDDIADGLRESGMLWEKLRLNLLRCSFKKLNRCDNDFVLRTLHKIKEKEEFVTDRILQLG